MQRLSYKLTEWAGKSWPAKRKKNESVGRAVLAVEAAHTDHRGHESRRECCTGDS